MIKFIIRFLKHHIIDQLDFRVLKTANFITIKVYLSGELVFSRDIPI